MSQTQAPAASAAPDAAPDPAAPRERKVPVLLLAVVGCVILVALGAGGWFLIGSRFAKPAGSTQGEPTRDKAEVAMKATIPLGAVVVNLDGGTRHYLKVAVDLGVPGPKDVKEVEEHKPQLLDLVITVLSAAPLERLGSGEGRTALKEQLLQRIHEELKLEKVGRVYFTEFVIQ